MSDRATIARESALQCEVRKIAYRQSRDGVVVSFVLHPEDVPDGLATSPLGSRWVLAMVELGDDEEPKPPTEKKEKAERTKQNWQDMSHAQQAGVLCNDPKFLRFIHEKYDYTIRDTDDVAAFVRAHCQVQSRREIRPGSLSGNRWHELVERYRVWELAPKVGA